MERIMGVLKGGRSADKGLEIAPFRAHGDARAAPAGAVREMPVERLASPGLATAPRRHYQAATSSARLMRPTRKGRP